MAPHSSTLAWKIPWAEEPGRLQSMGLQSQTRLSAFTLFLTVLCCCTGLSSCDSPGLLAVAVHGLLTAAASLVEHRL